MDNRQVISKLREHRDELTAAGIVHLRVFGSVARGEANDSSDVDLIAEFDKTMKLTLLDMVGLENRLVGGANQRERRVHQRVRDAEGYE